jgi:outer membrane protein assembly factor BamB
MYQVDAQHTGRSPHLGPRRAVLAATFSTGAYPTVEPATPRPDIQSSSAIGPDNTIYISNFPGNLFALRDGAANQLEVSWRFHPPRATSLHATPALGRDGTVYLGFSVNRGTPDVRGTLYALQAPTSGLDPRVIWTVDLGPAAPTASPTLGPDGTIYLVNSDGKLFVVGPDGALRWTTQTGPVLIAAPALAPDGTVYIASMDGRLYAVRPPVGADNEGSIAWTFDFSANLGPTPLVTAPTGGGGATGIGSGAPPTVGPDGTIYLGANNSNFYAIAPDGKLKWLYEAQRELAGIWTSATLSPDGSSLYFGANRGGVYALNRADGSLRWRFDIYGSVFSSIAIDRQGTLYTGSTVGHVYSIDSATGQQIFDYTVGEQVWTAPAIRPDGALVVADRTGRVMTFGPAPS